LRPFNEEFQMTEPDGEAIVERVGNTVTETRQDRQQSTFSSDEHAVLDADLAMMDVWASA
jgi:hypothetical protein